MTTAKQNGHLKSIAYRTGIMLALAVAASGIGYLFRALALPETNIVTVYLLAVLLTARLTPGYVFGFLGSLIATFSFNFFFTEPYFSFAVKTPSYIITFVIMTVTALITSGLTTHAKQNAFKTREREAEAKALYTLTNRLTDASGMGEIAGIATSAISGLMRCDAGCLCFDENGKPEPTFLQQAGPDRQLRREVTDGEALLGGTSNPQAGYAMGAEFYDWPICGREATLGVIRIPAKVARAMNEAQTRMLRSMIESTALAMDRFRATQQRWKSNEAIAQERYRGNLLRAISHDVRTPLAGIMGTAEMLLSMTAGEDPRHPLLEGIHQDANWLHSLVENILSLTRLQDGKLALNKQEEAVEEVVGAAVRHISRRWPEYEITVNVPEELLLVPMDARLIGQALVNLLDNAVKHTPPQGEINVSVTKDSQRGCAVFSVRDNGEGIADSDLPNIFEMFYTSRVRHADAQLGIGLGLAICETVVKAHGGSIRAANRADGPGAEFTFTLPLEVSKHEPA
jgi:two-component system sensor histidine kinase KdpD